jgi:hypothetical protein
VEVGGAHSLVMGRRIVFSKIVCEIIFSWSPIDFVLSWTDTVANPVEPHVHGFGPLLFDGVVRDPAGCRVVHLDGRGALWMAHFAKGGTGDCALFAVDEEEAVYFGIRGSRDNMLCENSSGIEDDTVIDLGFGWPISEIKVATNAATGFWHIEVTGVSVDF